MKRMCLVVLGLIFVCLTVAPVNAAESEAAKAADTFLKGIKLIDIPEGKEMVSSVSWNTIFPNLGTSNFPTYTELNTLFEGSLACDTPGVMAYKRVLDIKAVSDAGTPLLKKYLLVAFKDHSDGTWRVFWFEPSIDVAAQAEGYRKYAEGKEQWPGNYGDRAADWFSVALWSLLAGKVEDSRRALASARAELPEVKEKKDEVRIAQLIGQLDNFLVRISSAATATIPYGKK